MDRSELLHHLLQLKDSKGWEVYSEYLRQQALELNNKVLSQLISKDAENVNEAVINAQRIAVYNQVINIDWFINEIKAELADDAQE